MLKIHTIVDNEVHAKLDRFLGWIVPFQIDFNIVHQCLYKIQNMRYDGMPLITTVSGSGVYININPFSAKEGPNPKYQSKSANCIVDTLDINYRSVPDDELIDSCVIGIICFIDWLENKADKSLVTYLDYVG